MPAPTSYVGSTIGCVVATPATIDLAGFGALTYTNIGKVVQWGEIGDSSDNITIEPLDGRKEHINGAKDGGEVPFTVRTDTDAGQAILIAQSNGNSVVSFKVTDVDGKIAYFYGVVANVRDRERAVGNYKGLTGVVRVNSAVIRN